MISCESKVQDILSSNADQRDRVSDLEAYIDQLISVQNRNDLSTVIDILAADSVPLVISRPVLLHFAQSMENISSDFQQVLLKHAIDAIKTRSVSFEETDAKMRELLGLALADAEDYVGAARILGGINLESGRYTDAQKAEQYVRITELFLEEDETVEADRFVNRAAQFVHNCGNPLVQIRHKVSYARILDSKRKFLEASQRYYQLSIESLDVDGSFVAEEDLLHLLTKSITCAILASAGPQRTRILSLLYKDQRCKNFPVHFAVLEKMYMERLLDRSEIVAFDEILEPHQKAKLADGSTVLERAVIEHNVLAASKIYSNASFEELAKLLAIDKIKAVTIASSMIQEGRMEAEIDGVSGLVYFHKAKSPSAEFDTRIHDLCLSVNSILDRIGKQYPAFSVENL